MATHSSIIACKIKSLVGYSPWWGLKESDMTEHTHMQTYGTMFSVSSVQSLRRV